MAAKYLRISGLPDFTGELLNGVYHLHSEYTFETKWAKDGGALDEVPVIVDSSNEHGFWFISFMGEYAMRAEQTSGGALPTEWVWYDSEEPVEGMVLEEYQLYGAPSPLRWYKVDVGKAEYVKDPDATLDYTFDWTDRLAEDEEITNTEIIVPEGMTLLYMENTAKTVTCWLSGGVATLRYWITCRITTNQGRVDDRSISIWIKEQ